MKNIIRNESPDKQQIIRRFQINEIIVLFKSAKNSIIITFYE